MYRVIVKFKNPIPFNSYSKALAYQQANGGIIYQKVGSYGPK